MSSASLHVHALSTTTHTRTHLAHTECTNKKITRNEFNKRIHRRHKRHCRPVTWSRRGHESELKTAEQSFLQYHCSTKVEIKYCCNSEVAKFENFVEEFPTEVS